MRLSFTAAKQRMYSSAVTGRVLVVLRLTGINLHQSRKQVPCIIRLSQECSYVKVSWACRAFDIVRLGSVFPSFWEADYSRRRRRMAALPRMPEWMTARKAKSVFGKL